jgi:glycerol-3-phosphate dehydrogenase (NAD(P)+)
VPLSASVDKDLRERVQTLFHSTSLRVYTNPDVVGVEVGGALKNVFAIGV